MDSELEEIAKNVFHEDLAKTLKLFAEFQKELPNLDYLVRDQEFALTPRLFLAKAMESYTFGHFYGSVLLAGTAIEIGLREFVQEQVVKYIEHDKSKALVSQIFDEMDFRKVVELCKEFEVLGDKKAKIYATLHGCYNIRNKYSHGYLMKILGKLASEPITTHDANGKPIIIGTLGDDDLLRNAAVEGLAAHSDALELIKLVASSFDQIRKAKL
jgi:hypothetical protein